MSALVRSDAVHVCARKAAVATGVHGPHARVYLYPPVARIGVCGPIVDPPTGSVFSVPTKVYMARDSINMDAALHNFVSTTIRFAHGKSHPLIRCAVLGHDVVKFAIVVVVTGGEYRCVTSYIARGFTAWVPLTAIHVHLRIVAKVDFAISHANGEGEGVCRSVPT